MECSTNSFFQTMSDGAAISVNRWIPEGEIKAVIQMSHGMVEHSLRYDTLGSILAEQGFIFQAHDHRGHGKTAQYAEKDGTGMFGYFADKNGFDRVVDDIEEVLQKAKTDFPGKKVFLLGHSFGSFAAQAFCEKYGNEIEGCLICGSAGPRKALLFQARLVSQIIGFFYGKKHTTYLLDKMAFGAYNKRIPDSKTNHDWLSRDPVSVGMYESDDWCGFVPTVGFFQDMFKGLSQIHKSDAMKKIPSGLPVLIMYGTDDPVGGYGKTIHELAEIYKANGMKDVTEKAYEGARHELLNETNRDEVTRDIISWVSSRI